MNKSRNSKSVVARLNQALIRVEGLKNLSCVGFERVPVDERSVFVRELPFAPVLFEDGVKTIIKEMLKLRSRLPARVYSSSCKRILHLSVSFDCRRDACLFELPKQLLNELASQKMSVEVFVTDR